MSLAMSSLLDIRSLSQIHLQEFFSLAHSLNNRKRLPIYHGKSIALLFFEPSTRTRMSFETAAYRMGLGPVIFDGGQNTSLEKGESIEDSILNIAAMKPEFLIIRGGDDIDFMKIADQVSMPVINAGWGTKGHPTQALLDAFTIQNCLGSLEGKKILLVGDIKHSRVAASHFELAEKMGYQIGLAGPKEFLIDNKNLKIFPDLQTGLKWAHIVMALRVQFERHDLTSTLSKEEYRKTFGLNKESLQALDSKGLIMHPGPINHGIELETEVLSDPRCQVLNQVTAGVTMREALLRWTLGEKR